MPLLLAAGPLAGQDLPGRVVDADSGTPLVSAFVRAVAVDADHTPRTATTDTAGAFHLDLPLGRWRLEAEAFAYRPTSRELTVPGAPGVLELRLEPLPLVMDEMVVRARRDREAPTAAFVESLPIASRRAPAGDLALALDRATGVNVRRYGGLGSFSTVSIRGSTAEQVLVFLDGVPLNQAAGGGVDLGSLPLAGVEGVDVYRGAVPARFGGNSLGGVIHIRSRDLSRQRRLRLQAQTGSHGTRKLGASVTGTVGPWELLALVDHAASDNDFRFWDDNGTEYNTNDDGWSARRNSDYRSLRTVGKAGRALGTARVQIHNTFDLSHRGLPGIGSFQSLHTRYDVWRSLTEVLLYGPLGERAAGYRLKAYLTRERGEYKDPRGEVGLGSQQQRNRTDAFGLRLEGNAILPAGALMTVFANGRGESFTPRDLLRPETDPGDSRRRAVTAGGEAEISLWGDRLMLNGGGQVEGLDDRLFTQTDYVPGQALPRSTNRHALWSARVGAAVVIGGGWRAQGHVGRYARAPSFFELFGDRGAVFGNTDLTSEHGINTDAGLVYRGSPTGPGLLLAEVALYRNSVDDLIRFIQNSQRVSRPHNIGRTLTRGLETRLRARLASPLRITGGYVYQHAENRSPFSFEAGNDLPNAPRHRLHARLEAGGARAGLHYELSRESRHFLDRANLRPVPTRVIHNLGARAALAGGLSLAFEVQNWTDNQVADLWGYPLPGRSLFLSLSIETPSPPSD